LYEREGKTTRRCHRKIEKEKGEEAMSEVAEKIKEEGKTLHDLDDLLVKALDNDEEFEKLEQARWVRVTDVLKILAVYKEKLQELRREFPRLNGNMYWNQYIKDVEEWRKKFGEMEKEVENHE